MKFPKPWYRKSRSAWFLTLDGQQIRLGKTKHEAMERYRHLMASPPKTDKPAIRSDSVLAIIDAYLDWCQKHRAADTYEWYRYRLERFARRYPDLLTVDLRPYHVQEWLDDMLLSSGSKRNHCRAVKRCIRWAKQQGYVDVNPIADLEQPKCGKRETIISADDFNRIRRLVGNPAILELLDVTWETGCRPQESLRVEARNVDMTNQRWVFQESQSKTDFTRVVYLTDKALEITKRLVKRYPCGPLFRNSRGNPWTTDAVNNAFVAIQIRLGRQILNTDLQEKPKDKRRKYLHLDDADVADFAKTLNPLKQCGRAKMRAQLLLEARRKLTYRLATSLAPKYSLYVLRHTWMNRLLTKGVDSLTVAFLAGHSDPSTLARVYAHLSQNPAYLLEQAKKAAS